MLSENTALWERRATHALEKPARCKGKEDGWSNRWDSVRYSHKQSIHNTHNSIQERHKTRSSVRWKDDLSRTGNGGVDGLRKDHTTRQFSRVAWAARRIRSPSTKTQSLAGPTPSISRIPGFYVAGGEAEIVSNSGYLQSHISTNGRPQHFNEPSNPSGHACIR